MKPPSITDQHVQAGLLAAGWAPIKPEAIFRTVRAQDERIKELEASLASQSIAPAPVAAVPNAEIEALKDAVVAEIRLAMLELDQDQVPTALDHLRAVCVALA